MSFGNRISFIIKNIAIISQICGRTKSVMPAAAANEASNRRPITSPTLDNLQFIRDGVRKNEDQSNKPFTTKDPDARMKSIKTQVHYVYPIPIEIIDIAVEGSENSIERDSHDFNRKIGEEAVREHTNYIHKSIPELRKKPGGEDNILVRQIDEADANDSFFFYQRGIFETNGSEPMLFDSHGNPAATPHDDPRSESCKSNPECKEKKVTSWPGMQNLPEYQRLQSHVAVLSKRYMTEHVGFPEIENTTYSIFSWFAVSRRGTFHNTHTHVGEWHVAVYYVKTGKGAGSLVFSDPRGQILPFGREIIIHPKEGQIVMFPSWLGHMATASGDASADDPRVILAFNIGPETGAPDPRAWYLDPTTKVILGRDDVPISERWMENMDVNRTRSEFLNFTGSSPDAVRDSELAETGSIETKESSGALDRGPVETKTAANESVKIEGMEYLQGSENHPIGKCGDITNGTDISKNCLKSKNFDTRDGSTVANAPMKDVTKVPSTQARPMMKHMEKVNSNAKTFVNRNEHCNVELLDIFSPEAVERLFPAEQPPSDADPEPQAPEPEDNGRGRFINLSSAEGRRELVGDDVSLANKGLSRYTHALYQWGLTHDLPHMTEYTVMQR